MTSDQTKVRKGRKFDQVLAGARDVFMADGFEGASVDAIARAAGVSKATLYSYFPDKRLLFMEVADTECARQSRQAFEGIDTDAPPRVVLGLAGRHLLGFITSTFGQQMFRLCVAECDRFPELGQRFYNSGPAVVRREMAGYFETAVARGQLRMEDPLLAADQFGELCKGDVWLRLTFGIIDRISQAESDRVVDSAVDMFLARYAA